MADWDVIVLPMVGLLPRDRLQYLTKYAPLLRTSVATIESFCLDLFATSDLLLRLRRFD